MLLLFATEVSCARWGAAELFEPHVRIRNLPSGDAPGRQQVWFDFCVRYDDASTLECGIQSHEAWLDLEAGSRNLGARVRGHFEGQREAWVKPEEGGRIAGKFDAVVCDANAPAGLRLVEDPDDNRK